MAVYAADELQKTSVTSSATDLDPAEASSLFDFQSSTAASSLEDLLWIRQSSSFGDLPSCVHLPSVSDAAPATAREQDVPIETATDIDTQRGSITARERRSEYVFTAAEETADSNVNLDQIANATDSHTASPTWRLLNDALATYPSGSTPRGGDVVRCRRSNRWLSSLGSLKLPQPRPPPLKGSGASPISAAGCPLLPAAPGSLEASGRPNTSGGAYVRPHLRPGTEIKRPETSPSVGKRLSGDSVLPRSTASKRTKRTRAESDSLRKKHTKLRPVFGLCKLAGRLGEKALKIPSSRLAPCNLARSTRKQTLFARKLCREEEQIAAEAVSGTFETFENEQRLLLLTTHRNNNCRGLNVRTSTRGSTHKNNLNSQLPVGAAFSSAEDQAPVRRSAPPQLNDLDTFQAHDLAVSWNLPKGQVTRAWQCFKRYDKDDDGLLSSLEFQMLLRSVLRESFSSAKEIPRSLFNQIDEIKSNKRAANFLDFLQWLSRHSFNEEILADAEQRFVRRIARRLQTPINDIEIVKRHFDSFDTDGSGQIDYDEFSQLLGKLLNLDDMSDLPESRIKSFWRQVDGDRSGVVEFGEFAPWYVGYFGCRQGQGETPLVNFYRQVRPNPFRDVYRKS